MSEQRKKGLLGFFTFKRVVFAFVIIAILGVAGVYAFESYASDNPEFCDSCHIMDSYVMSYYESNHLDNIHMQANVHCKDCHSDYTVFDEAKSLINTVTGKTKRITKIEVSNDMCLQCHAGYERREISTDYLTKNPHASHYDNMRCTTCHLSHANQNNFCGRCHDNGGQRMIEDFYNSPTRGHNPYATKLSDFGL